MSTDRSLAPYKVRESWRAVVDGKVRKFITEDAAWEALGGKPDLQLELEWNSEEKSFRNGVIGMFRTREDNSSS